MSVSFRMDEHLLARLRRYAQAREISASAVVREALARYLDHEQASAYELGADLFGRHRSLDAGTSARSVERKARMRSRVRAKRRPG